MPSKDNALPSCKKNKKKQQKYSIFILILITLFLLSFSGSAFILIRTNQLTFAGGDEKDLCREVRELKAEIARKDSEIAELKVQLVNEKSSSRFTDSCTPETQP